MDYIQNMVVLAVILLGATLVFPAQGYKALVMRAVNGIFFGIAAVLFFVVVMVKLPVLGWTSVSMPFFSVAVVVCFIKMGITLVKALTDLIKKETKEYILYPWTLVRGSTFHTATSVYYIKGYDQTDRKVRFYVDKNTFLDLADEAEHSPIQVKVFTHTRIVINAGFLKK